MRIFLTVLLLQPVFLVTDFTLVFHNLFRQKMHIFLATSPTVVNVKLNWAAIQVFLPSPISRYMYMHTNRTEWAILNQRLIART